MIVKRKIAVIGMGYVGLPLALSFGKIFNVVGFDIDRDKIHSLNLGQDITKEHDPSEFQLAEKLRFSTQEAELVNCNTYIVAVPTPVDKNKVPDLGILISATKLVSKFINRGDTVIFESTVYPGTTNEICLPILSNNPNNILVDELKIGYSPERINPGDTVNTLENVVKLVGCDDRTGLTEISDLYRTIIKAGVWECSTIKIAEGAKIIENVKRDVNIGLINELKILFDKLEINFEEVLSAARTKWNFLDFKPGLVGGHCIGVDPYYLTHKAREVNFTPELILAGRRINDSMAEYYAIDLVKKLISKKIEICGSNLLVCGFAFKKNCSDPRNTKVFDLILLLQNYGINVDVFDPLVDPIQVKEEYGLCPKQDFTQIRNNYYDAILIAVEHEEIVNMPHGKLIKKSKEKEMLFYLNGKNING